MAQHFLLSKQAKTLTLAQVFRMSDAEAEAMFKRIRWAATNGEPACSHCGSLDAYDSQAQTLGPATADRHPRAQGTRGRPGASVRTAQCRMPARPACCGVRRGRSDRPGFFRVCPSPEFREGGDSFPVAFAP